MVDAKEIIGSDPLSWWFPYIVALIVGIVTCIREYVGGQICPSKNQILKKIILITGGSGGIALEIGKELAKRGGIIILACKNANSGAITKDCILKAVPTAHVIVKVLNVASMADVKRFVGNDLREFRKIDILINNAALHTNSFQLTDDNFELHLATNYLGHFLLTHLLLPRLKAATKARIINITDSVHQKVELLLDDINRTTNWDGAQCYAQSKLCMVLMAKYMAKLLAASTTITINAVAPGVVRNTGLHKESPCNNSLVKVWTSPLMWLLMKSPTQGSQSIIYAAVDVNLDKISGRYISNCEIQNNCKKAQGDKLCEALYHKTCELLEMSPGIKNHS